MMIRKQYILAGLVLGMSSACASSDGEPLALDMQGAPTLGRVGEALEAEECLVPEEVLEHTCQHAQFGPFVATSAQAYPGFVFTDISPAHTAYNLTLPAAASAFGGAVLFSPVVSGEFAVFTTPDTTVNLYDSLGNAIGLEREGATDPAVCSAIAKASVFHLEVFESYTVVFGPEADATLQTIVEYLGEGGCEGCAHLHLDAYRSLNPAVNEPANVGLDEPIAFEVPETIAVEVGEARRGTVTLRFSDPEDAVKCVYEADRTLNAFVFDHCDCGVTAGDDVTAREFKLSISRDAVKRGPIGVELEIEDEACHGHEHEE